MAAGAHYPTATLTLRKAGESKPYLTYTFKTVFTTKIDHSGSSPEAVSEEITFVFGQVLEQVTDGDVTRPGRLEPGHERRRRRAVIE